MAKSGSQRVKEHRQRVKERVMAAELFEDFCKAFPGQCSFNVADYNGPELNEAENGKHIRLSWTPGLNEAIARFALERDMSVDDLYDRLIGYIAWKLGMGHYRMVG